MISALIDGLTILSNNLVAITFFFVSMLGLGLLPARYIVGGKSNMKIRLLVGFGIGSVILGLISYALVIVGHFWPFFLRPGSILILGFSVVVLIIELWPKGHPSASDTKLFVIIGSTLFLLLIIRLVFLKYILLPPYSDSVIHYQIVRGFLDPGLGGESNLSLENLPQHYYHFGFHSLTAWLTSVSELDPIAAMPLLGQLLLVIAPVSIMLLTYVITRDKLAALFAGLLAAVGWSMPAFAVNWGKYPAIAAMSTMPAVIACFSFYRPEIPRKSAALFWGLLLLIGITLMHSRIIIVVSLAAASFMLCKRISLKEELSLAQALRLSVLYLISLAPLHGLLTEFYSQFIVAFIFLGLLPFAFQSYPRLALGVVFFTFFLWLVTLAPTFLAGFGPTLVDKQFAEMLLYVPFSILGGAGLGGLIKRLPAARLPRSIAGIILVVLLVWNFSTVGAIYPDPCCVYFSEGDQSAFEWIRANTTEQSLILIPAFENEGQIFGTDAGIWIYALTGRSTNKLPFNINWERAENLEQICGAGAREIYIYMGGREFSFEHTQLAQATWAKSAYQAGKTVIYRVTRCSG